MHKRPENDILDGTPPREVAFFSQLTVGGKRRTFFGALIDSVRLNFERLRTETMCYFKFKKYILYKQN